MPQTSEHKKALLIWRLRRDLEAFKALCLQFDRQGIDKGELRKFLIEMNCCYDELQHRLRE